MSAETYLEGVNFNVDDGIGIITLNMPNSRNALSLAVIETITNLLEDIEKNKDVKVLIFQAIGNVFCAGHDLKEITKHRSAPDRGQKFFKEIMAACSTMMQMIVNFPKPIIGSIEGVATAAGCQLVASFDLAIAGEKARFCTPGVNIGLFCSTPMVALSRNVSKKQSMEMLLLGDLIPAEKAKEFGLVNRVVDIGTSFEAAMEWARIIASKSPMTLKIGKQAFYKQAEMTLDDAYTYTSQVMVENMLSYDAEEGIAAFVEKRSPDWKGE